MMKRTGWQSTHHDLDFIINAERCEKNGHLLESQKLFEEGIAKIRNSIRECRNIANKEFYKEKLKQFEDKSHKLRKYIDLYITNSKLLSELFIPAESRGYSFGKLFSDYLNESVIEVHIYESTLEKDAHFKHLIHFLEVVVKSCPNLQFIRVITKRDPRLTSQQVRVFQSLKSDMSAGNLVFNYQFDSSFQENKIIFNNGTVIKSSRGLHIYHTNINNYKLGICDYDFCPCYECVIKIYRAQPFHRMLENRHNRIPVTEIDE